MAQIPETDPPFLKLWTSQGLSWMTPRQIDALQETLADDVLAMTANPSLGGVLAIEFRRCVNETTGALCWCKYELQENPPAPPTWVKVDMECP